MRLGHRFIDACGLRGSDPFRATVKEPRLKQPGRQSRMVLTECALDGLFPALGELEPRCDLGGDRGQHLLVIPHANVRRYLQVSRLSVDTDSRDGFKRDASTLVCE